VKVKETFFRKGDHWPTFVLENGDVMSPHKTGWYSEKEWSQRHEEFLKRKAALDNLPWYKRMWK